MRVETKFQALKAVNMKIDVFIALMMEKARTS
jgi:hypothetical protein